MKCSGAVETSSTLGCDRRARGGARARVRLGESPVDLLREGRPNSSLERGKREPEQQVDVDRRLVDHDLA